MADLQNMTYGDKVFTIPVYDDEPLKTRINSVESAINNRYTKSETDEKIAEAMTDVDNEHFHPVTALPNPADEDVTKRPKENHEYVLIEYEQDGTTIKSETHYLFYGGVYHQKSTGGVSLEGYATEDSVNTKIAKMGEFDVAAIPQGQTGANEINAVVSNTDHENVRVSYVRQSDGTLPKTVNLGVTSGLGEDSFLLATVGYANSMNKFLFVPTNQDNWQDAPTQGEGVRGVELTTPYTYEELVASGKQIAVKIDSTSENADSCLVILQHYDDNASNRQFYGYITYVDWINGEEHYYIDTVQIVKQTLTDKTWLYHRTSEIKNGAVGGTVDQTYDAASTNAQSGTAVAEAVADAAYDDTALATRVTGVESQFNTRNYTFADTLLLDVDLPHTMPWDEFSAMGFPQSTYQENTVYNVVTFNSSYDKEYPKIRYFNDSQDGAIKTIRYKLDERQSSASSEETLVVEYDIANQTATITTGGTIGVNKSHIKVYSPRIVYGVTGKVSEDFNLRVLENAATKSEVGDLTTLNTNAQDNLVNAVNELKYAVDGLGEPFRVKEWSADNLTATIPACSQEVNNTSIDKVVYTITGQEAIDYQVVGMIAYQLLDASGNRINAWPVCQFTGGGQSELHVRFMCAGTSSKSAKSIKAWVLLKHR